MKESVGLVLYAITAGTLGAAALRRARWPAHAPRLGVIAWQVLSTSILIALLLGGLMLVAPVDGLSARLADILHACAMALRAQYATPGGAVLHGTGVAAVFSLVTWTAYLLVTGLRDAQRASAHHLAGLQLVAHRDANLDALIVDHPAAAAYCLPGRNRTIVLTSAAVAALSQQELEAVLAHEQAHLQGRHHLVAATAAALARAVPFPPGLRWARTEQSRLLEMIADDAAAAGGARLLVARALITLGGVGVPAAALGAADVSAAARVERLLTPAHHLGRCRRLLIASMLGAVVLAPFAIASAPAVVAAGLRYCPIPVTTSVVVVSRGEEQDVRSPGW